MKCCCSSRSTASALRVWFAGGLLLLCALFPPRARAEQRWSVGGEIGGALMMSQDQRSNSSFLYDKFSGIGAVSATYGNRRAWEARGSAHFATFPSSSEDARAGALLATTIGPMLRRRAPISPYAGIGFGAGVTGTLVRPFFSIDAGLDFQATERLSVGPSFGYGHLVQWNGERYSTDARYFWCGIAARFLVRAAPKRVAVIPPPPAPRRRVAPPPPPPQEPAVDVVQLIERALPSPTKRVELLAPILFDFDSAELTPTSIAMLHEVAAVLREHPEIELVEINAYADARGAADYNLELSTDRAEEVHTWLLEHGIAPVRLQLAPRGASAFVEPGAEDAAHEQNRRVTFRILREAISP